MSRDFQKAARHIIGPTGYQWSNAWKRLEDDDGSYLSSFDPRIPPSIHISSRDKTRANMAVPLVERCIEDWNDQHADPESAGAVRRLPSKQRCLTQGVLRGIVIFRYINMTPTVPV